jgi:tetratricopeptide (TPR) repeat protein
MRKILISFFIFLITATFSLGAAYAQNINLLPKYGSMPKNEAQLAADKELLAAIDKQYNGDRKKAAEDAAMRGWQSFRQGDTATAMKRFNQAWLLDNKNGTALWGMAAIQGKAGKMDESLKLFSEAEQYVGNDIDFAVDHARTIGVAAVTNKNDALLKDAFNRYEQLYKRAPQNVLNLQNWAIVLYYTDNYAEAWKKIKLAEVAPRGNELDKNFIAELQNKMPRPK